MKPISTQESHYVSPTARQTTTPSYFIHHITLYWQPGVKGCREQDLSACLQHKAKVDYFEEQVNIRIELLSFAGCKLIDSFLTVFETNLHHTFAKKRST